LILRYNEDMAKITLKRLQRINPNKIADRATYYLEGHKLYQKELVGVRGMVTPLRIKSGIRKIDKLTRECLSLEEKIDRLLEKRALESAKLEDALKSNLKIAQQYLSPEEYADFRG